MAREIVLDTETTGFEPREGHRLVELACLEIEDFVPTGRTFHCYIDPERDMPPEAQKVHGLSADFLRGKPKFHAPEVVDAFLDFVGDAPIVAHNAAFDRTFVNHELGLCGRVEIIEHRWVDTLVLARTRFPGMANSLDALCRRFKISLADREKHGALDRKSTRLNSSHVVISYAVFGLKKKNKKHRRTRATSQHCAGTTELK